MWSYPRPPRLEMTRKRLRVLLGTEVLKHCLLRIWLLHHPFYTKSMVWSFLMQTFRAKRVQHRQVVADTTSAYRVLETSHPPAYYIPPSDVNTQLLKDSPSGSTFCEWKGSATYWDVFAEGQTVRRRCAYFRDSSRLPGARPWVYGHQYQQLEASILIMRLLSQASSVPSIIVLPKHALTCICPTIIHVCRVWSYEQPTQSFQPIKSYLSFYASPFTCFVEDEQVKPQVRQGTAAIVYALQLLWPPHHAGLVQPCSWRGLYGSALLCAHCLEGIKFDWMDHLKTFSPVQGQWNVPSYMMHAVQSSKHIWACLWYANSDFPIEMTWHMMTKACFYSGLKCTLII